MEWRYSMERRSKTRESLSAPERQKLVKKVLVHSDFLHTQLIGAPRDIREAYIPILSTSAVLQSEQATKKEEPHLRKVVAIQWDIFKTIPDGVGGLEQLRDEVYQLAGPEIEERSSLEKEVLAKIPAWQYAYKDADKLQKIVSATLDELEK